MYKSFFPSCCPHSLGWPDCRCIHICIQYIALSLSQSWVIFVWFVSFGFPAVLANVLLLPAGEHLYLMIVHSDFSDFEFALLVSLTNIIPPTRIPSNNETNDETPVHWQIHHISAMCFFLAGGGASSYGDGPPKLARWHSWRIRIFTIIYFATLVVWCVLFIDETQVAVRIWMLSVLIFFRGTSWKTRQISRDLLGMTTMTLSPGQLLGPPSLLAQRTGLPGLGLRPLGAASSRGGEGGGGGELTPGAWRGPRGLEGTKEWWAIAIYILYESLWGANWSQELTFIRWGFLVKTWFIADVLYFFHGW